MGLSETATITPVVAAAVATAAPVVFGAAAVLTDTGPATGPAHAPAHARTRTRTNGRGRRPPHEGKTARKP